MSPRLDSFGYRKILQGGSGRRAGHLGNTPRRARPDMIRTQLLPMWNNSCAWAASKYIQARTSILDYSMPFRCCSVPSSVELKSIKIALHFSQTAVFLYCVSYKRAAVRQSGGYRFSVFARTVRRHTRPSPYYGERRNFI